MTGNLATVDLTLPAVSSVMSGLAAANILTTADQATLQNMATPLLMNMNGWANGVTANDITNAQQYLSINAITSQVSKNWNSTASLLQTAQQQLVNTPAGTLASVTTPSVSTVTSTFSTGLSW
jgi:hypothetical protein